jgi:nitrogen regulatory protein PII
MKLLIAYVRTSKRSAVEQALRATGLTGWSESTVKGYGRAARGREVEHVRIEMVVADEEVQELRQAVTEAARTSEEVGDGMIVGLPLDFSDRF